MPAVSVLALLVACGGDDARDRTPAETPVAEAPTAEAPAAPVVEAPPSGHVPADTLVVAVSADPKDLLPIFTQAPLDNMLVSTLQRTPLASDVDCGLRVSPRLYRSWSFSADGRTLEVELRDDVAWEDGTPVTAADVARTYALVADPAVASPRAEATRRMAADARPRVLGPHRLAFGFLEPYDPALMLEHAALDPVPVHRLADVDPAALRRHPLNTTAPLSKGPWRLAAWEPGTRLVLEPNPAGPADERPSLRRVVLRVLPEPATRVLALENGEVDLVENVAVDEADRLAARPDVALHRRGWRNVDVVAWNALDPVDREARAQGLPAGQRPRDVRPHALFGDPDVRRALARAIDTGALIRTLLTSRATGAVYGRPAIGTVSPALCGAHADDVSPLPFDPAAARAALAAEGWTDGDGDGVLDKDGAPFRFRLLVGSANPRRARAAEMVEAQLRAVGVAAEIEPVASSALGARLRQGDFDAALTGWSAALFVDPGTIWAPDAPNNVVGYADPEVAALIDAGRRETDPARANATWKEVQRRVYADQPYAFLYWADEIVAVHRRFRGVRSDLLAPWRDLHRWWVPPDEVRYR